MATSDADSSCSLDDQRIDELLDMIVHAATISVLRKLENHRENLEESTFRSLLLSLTTKLNTSEWTGSASMRNKHIRTNRSKSIPSQTQINRCSLTILQYIVSVIHKYQIPSVENLWNEILKNSLTETTQFYQYLHEKKIVIPSETCRLFCAKISVLSAFKSLKNRIRLIELGFVFNRTITEGDSIRNLEKIFSIVKQQKMLDEENIDFKLWITMMNTPEKLSLFLSYFPNYDINEINSHNQMNVLEQLIQMEPYFYLADIHTNNSVPVNGGFSRRSLRSHPKSELGSHPNDIVNYRAVRIVTLFQQMILHGARLSKPIRFNQITQLNVSPFFKTSLGIYVLLSLYTKDLLLDGSFAQAVRDFVLFILGNIKRFEQDCQDLILHRLASTYSLVHQPAFINQRRRVENEDDQRINDKLFQRPIKLKDWCRLKIRENVSFHEFPTLNLPQLLINYCSFDLYDSKYGLQCIQEVRRHRGNIKPKHLPLPISMDDNPDEEEDGASSRDNESYISESYDMSDDDMIRGFLFRNLSSE